MAARMDATRRMIADFDPKYGAAIDALAEVEEWEADAANVGKNMLVQIELRQAAEAERDKLKEALKTIAHGRWAVENNDWTGPDGARKFARAALAAPGEQA